MMSVSLSPNAALQLPALNATTNHATAKTEMVAPTSDSVVAVRFSGSLIICPTSNRISPSAASAMPPPRIPAPGLLLVITSTIPTSPARSPRTNSQ